MDPFRPDVVFDCNVFIQAISRANGPAAQSLRLVDQNVVTLHISKPLLRELRQTLAYPEIRQRNPHITSQVIDVFLSHISFRGILCREIPHVFDLPRDPDDEPYIDLAVAVNATYLVTRDQDLLSLATDHTSEAKEFRQRVPRLSVLNPVGFLDQLRRTHPTAFRL
jgi:putative PIN family toxin of toxin-antitoxin system